MVFYQVSLVNQTKIFCLDFKIPSEVLVVLYHMFIPRGGVVIKCSHMIVPVKESVSWTLFVNPISPECFFPCLLLVVE